ncbi:putative mitochondrial hypothetical protein [Leptomonas pyrrhocoris]|uniref:Uncharacterized protein n=1 Tax=Leptomonas pyrrhocoris TaxID=157538 RepID=A0A0M9G053_LEPPY|nr:putative mitochondrial hypothetical protein [Leptomonas pyrrhocoris]XP_015658095.1 putative mitochondrial hypothetical protein [Leptomonas pyrrhocoris]XP_015658096.1 putative mitochondrial hypothetical protein [Leptomonas pyrrhocoris]KPA79655.1 putative mitochondrial hypothetical protein [Leptomonas pyrrhocoris]KPA79656.1 putative mitochondrial hypothetical protein [Leptomonas pyrrhocoris]KPA79657.1 putative mitochondrial hypothetical protein [Leptomonas pyrrhocoris]|eukprot:XP_015658094.1 putative mitochondrial hypothetical protein [Leptomonas pyrrhocoris]
MNATATNAAAAQQPASKAQEQITHLPRYFPTACPQCAAQTDAFFQCFEKHAVMMNEHDVVTAHNSLQHCQPELRAYMTCMEKYIANKDRPWWKFW